MAEISILIPVYNREKYIAECINSILEQTFQDFTIIIYNDGSTDTTVSIIENFKSEKIILINNEVNLGVGHARNMLLQHVNTPYACWQDSDDCMEKNRLEQSYTYIKEHNMDIVYSYIQCFPKKRLLKIDVTKYNEDYNSLAYNTTCASGFFTKECAQYSTLPLRYGAEDSFWLYTLLMNGKKVGLLPEPLYLYRQHSNRLCNNINKHLEAKNIERALLHNEIEKLKKEHNINV